MAATASEESPTAAHRRLVQRTHSEVWGPNCRSVPTSQVGSVVMDDIHRYTGRPLAVVTIGLPARGKSHLAHKLCRYCNWIGIEARTFISVSYAAKILEMTQRKFDTDFLLDHMDVLHDWQPILDLICHDIKEFIGQPPKSSIAVLDLLCCTTTLRKYIYDQLREVFAHDRIVFLEIMVDDSKCEHLVRIKARESPEYKEMDEEEALTDIKRRIAGYKEKYEPVSDEFCYIRAHNPRHTINGIKGYLPSRIVNWVLNARIGQLPNAIYFFPPPENEFSLQERLGGDPSLTQRGREEAKQLFKYMQTLHGKDDLEIWTSGLLRSIQTGERFSCAGYMTKRWRALNEIHMGACEGLTRKEVNAKFPFIEELRKNNKYYFRFPQGESYLDLVHRLDRVILSLDRAEKPVLVLGHRAVLRELLAYYHEAPAEEGVQRRLPPNTLWKYSCSVTGKADLQEIVLAENHGQSDRMVSGDSLDDF
eukprot:GGOE01023193.1.p2 GENE.GGOE01023193.1~~GGOE01023193.1.p2  ORF type:complete len:486 (+),score=160.71 GGOE01023193.1:30-1460(+)